MDPEVNVRKRI